jgi:hypothetical protein
MRSWTLWLCACLCVACGETPTPAGTDAGSSTDAGSLTDAGGVTDSGTDPDAGDMTDAGSVDADGGVDAGPPCSSPTAHGPRFPGVVKSVEVEAAWVEELRALEANGSPARVELNSEGSKVLRFSGFGVSLPTGSTITGATVRVNGRTPTAATDLTAVVRFGRTTGPQTSPERANVAFTTTNSVHELFGPGETWGGSLWRGIAILSNFAMEIGFEGPPATVLEVDNVTLEIFYMDGGVAKTTGPLAPTAVTQAGLARAWLSTDLALTVNGEAAVVQAMVDHETTARLESSNYGFELPDDALVAGIRVDVTRQSATAGGIRDLDLRLLKDGAPTGVSRSGSEEEGHWPPVFMTIPYGWEGDSWGRAWTVAEIESPGFGAGLRAHYPEPSGNDSAQVDAVGITVFTCP